MKKELSQFIKNRFVVSPEGAAELWLASLATFGPVSLTVIESARRAAEGNSEYLPAAVGAATVEGILVLLSIVIAAKNIHPFEPVNSQESTSGAGVLAQAPVPGSKAENKESNSD